MDLYNTYCTAAPLYNTWCTAVDLYNTYWNAVPLYNKYCTAVSLYKTCSTVVPLYKKYCTAVPLYKTYCTTVPLFKTYSTAVPLYNKYCIAVDLYKTYCTVVQNTNIFSSASKCWGNPWFYLNTKKLKSFNNTYFIFYIVWVLISACSTVRLSNKKKRLWTCMKETLSKNLQMVNWEIWIIGIILGLLFTMPSLSKLFYFIFL